MLNDGQRLHSVETNSSRASTAARSVCHARLAHFTRTGNWRTPASTESLPRSSTGRVRRRGDHLLEPLEQRCRLRAIVFPLTLSVISEADAFEIAQPDP